MAMRIVHAKGLFMLDECPFALKEIPAGARGWRWHNPGKCRSKPCAACLAMMPPRHWWAEDEAAVAVLARRVLTAGLPPLEFGDDELAERIAAAAAVLPTERTEREAQQHWLDELDYKGDPEGE